MTDPSDDLLVELVAELVKIPVCATFQGRGTLLPNMGASLNRDENNPRVDLTLALHGVTTLHGSESLVRVIDSAVFHVPGTPVETSLKALRRRLRPDPSASTPSAPTLPPAGGADLAEWHVGREREELLALSNGGLSRARILIIHQNFSKGHTREQFSINTCISYEFNRSLQIRSDSHIALCG
jgi:hypothetical protein